MKKVLLFCIIMFVFLWGLTLGGDFSNGASNFFEEAKQDFEQNITKPNNDYQNLDLVPKEYTINKTARKIEEFISSNINKVFDLLG